jgi:CobQ-like glutamine amidotransferase family enzyme
MRVEILYPEICNLSGDGMNIRYLHQCCPALEILETGLKDRPAFPDGSADLVYLGSATEKGLELMTAALKPYRKELSDRIDAGQLMLVTGNALDALGSRVTSDDGWQLEGLGLLDTHAEYHMMDRHNSFFLGQFEGMDIVGFKSLFGHTYGASDGTEPLFTVEKGVGRFPGAAVEGFRRKNLLATYLTGPLLVLNPPFTKWLLRQMGAPDTLAFEAAAMANYEKRVAEFRETGRPYMY